MKGHPGPIVFPAGLDPAQGIPRAKIFIKTALLILIVLAGKWWLIDGFGGEVPFADQWAAEGETIYLPMLRGEWTWDRVFHAWNEHRIVPSRLFSIALFHLTNLQWDPTLELAASAMIHALLLGGMGGWLMRHSQLRWHPWICLWGTALGILPFAYENTLWGFQSSFYFLLFFSLLSGCGLLSVSAKRIGWWIGLLAGFTAIFSLGSGGLVGAALLPVLLVRSLKRKRVSIADVMTALAAVTFIIVGWTIRVHVPEHVKLATASWPDFCLALWTLLAWPFSGNILIALVIWMPVGIFLFRLWQRRSTRLSPVSEAVLFLAGWTLVQLMAIAWLRGSELAFLPPPSRYLDINAIGLVANFAAVIALHGGIKSNPGWLRRGMPVWAFVVGIGLVGVSSDVATDRLGAFRVDRHSEKDRLAAYMRGGDSTALRGIERWDKPALLITHWRGRFEQSLPPCLQARPPLGFDFVPLPDWTEGGFDAHFSDPGGYVTWGNRSPGNAPAGKIDTISAPFRLRRGAVAFSYAMSLHPGNCVLEFLRNDGRVEAGFSAFPSGGTGGRIPFWYEVSLRISPGEYRLRIHDDQDGGSFAVTAPREMSVAGFFVRRWLGFSQWLFVAAGIALVLSLFGAGGSIQSDS